MGSRFSKFCISFVLTCVSALASAADLVVEEGQSFSLPAGQSVFDLDELVLKDGSTLFVNNGQSTVMIRAKKVSVGDNVEIIGSGSAGSVGVNGKSISGSAQKCAKPLHGESGSQGGDGADGIDLNLDWGIHAFGSLKVDLSGGDAGPGGNGGDGQDADEDSNCAVVSGGDAGAGGASGNAGSGGSLTYIFRGLDSDEQAFQAKERTAVNNKAGALARHGQPGRPGSGTPGRYVNKKSLSGSRTWVGGGDDGKIPEPNKAGQPGSDGQVVFQIAAIATPSVAARTFTAAPKKNAASDVVSLEDRMRQLEAELARLAKRVSELESR